MLPVMIELYKRLERVKEAKCEEDRLLRLRERLEIEIQRLSHQPTQDEELLAKCFAEMRALDLRLDDLEELTEGSSDDLRKKILDSISPNEKGLLILQDIHLFVHLEEETSRLEAESKLLLSHLNALFEQRERVKKRSLLSYIFGSNPHATINQAMKGATDVVKKQSEHLALLVDHPKARELLKTYLKSYLETLKTLESALQGGWSFEKIDQTFSQHHQELERLVALIQEEKSALKAQRLAEEAQLDRWIFSVLDT